MFGLTRVRCATLLLLRAYLANEAVAFGENSDGYLDKHDDGGLGTRLGFLILNA